jgi:DNA-binding winged helix-turn-helix (wHTH) protein/tetratricopeptide (TPR) repeat protein
MPHNHQCYEFGPYRLDPDKCVLSRAGETILLTPKASKILLVLVANAGQLVGKDELLQEVWPDTFVEESNLTQNIFTLRRVLGDERTGPRYIETVTRRGYRFVATVRIVSRENHNGEVLAPPVEATQREVVAVLPFVNATGDPGIDYLADGVTDNIINNLARVSKLRVMSRSTVFRYKTQELDPQQIGINLGATAVLVGKINARPSGIVIGVELVDASTGWQVWGESFDCHSKDILEIQDAITRQLLTGLKLQLSGEEEKRVTARYTENAEAYQSYLEGRYHWSRYTRKGIEKAIGHFRHSIDLDPNYALAYAGIVDCYLRLATNYLPPEDDLPPLQNTITSIDDSAEPDPKVKLRFEWDWKGAERELRRANELKTPYPSAHQWYAAYRTSQQIYEESGAVSAVHSNQIDDLKSATQLASQIVSIQLTPTEEVQILCSIAREQIAVGNFDAGNLILRRWAQPGKWPKLNSLNPYAAADLLFTLGTLIGCVAGAKRVIHGQKQAEAFLTGSVALFEQLGMTSRSVEAQVELSRCFYRQGLFDVARNTLASALSDLPDDQTEIKSVALVLWGVVERDSGRLTSSVTKLREASTLEVAGRLVTGRCCHELATTLKELAISEKEPRHSDEAKVHFIRALYESEAIGNHRLAAAVENNMGFLLLSLGLLDESEKHLLRSRRLFDGYSDNVRGAQVNETLARLYLQTKQYSLAQRTIERAIETLELTDGEALLAEALTTKGVVARRLDRYTDAKRSFEAAYRVAERCGDHEGAGRALLIMFEEMGERLEQRETLQVSEKLKKLFATTQQTALLGRVEKSIAEIGLRTKRKDKHF